MSNPPGEFVWYELTTRDADGAQAFHAALLGSTYANSGQAARDYRTIPLRQGEILFGPSEIPGGNDIITGGDPQGAAFSLAGPRS